MANRKKSKVSLVYFLYIIIIFSALLFYVWQRIQSDKIGYKIIRLQKNIADLKNKNKHLRVEINSLKSLDRIEKIAIEELKMVKPDKESVIILPGDNL